MRIGSVPLLRRRPDVTEEYSTSHLGHGVDYDESFEDLPMRAVIWEQERMLLDELAHGPLRPVATGHVVDLACGTGRITEQLVAFLPEARMTGVDIAASMLEVARQRVPSAEFIEMDATKLPDALGYGAIDLITAFRFFANADAGLRRAIVDSIDRALRPGGLLMTENHRNFWSLSYLARRARGRSGAPGALNQEVIGPFLDRGYQVIARRSLGLFPHADDRAYALSLRSATAAERFNARYLSKWHDAGTHVVWVLRKP